MVSPRSTLSWLFVSTALLKHCVAQQQKTCYYPDGSIAKGDHPCDTNAEHSPCCAGDVLANQCLANKLCLSPKGRYARGSCTDPTWTSPDCPQYCIANNLAGGSDLSLCSSLSDQNPSFCCIGATDCCAQQSNQFILHPAPYDTWAVWDKDSNRYEVVAPLSTAPSSATTSSSSSHKTTASGASHTSSDSTETTGPSGPDTTSSSPSNDSNDSNDSNQGLSTGAKAGIGIGAAVGALLIAAVAYLSWKLRRASQTSGIGEQAADDRDLGARIMAAGVAPVYYDPMVKHELGSEGLSHELQGQNYQVRGDGRSAEMGSGSPYSAESPVARNLGHH